MHSRKNNLSLGSNRNSVIKLLARDLGDRRLKLFLCVLFIMVSKLVLAAAPPVAGNITDYIVKVVDGGSIDINWLLTMCLLLMGMFLVGYGTDIIINRIMVSVSQGLIMKLRNRAQHKMNLLKLNYIDTHPTGDILSRVTNDMITLSNAMESTVSNLLGQVVLLFGLLIAMILTDWRLTLIYIAVLPMGMIATLSIAKRTNKLFKLQNDTVGDLNSKISDTYSNHILMKAYGCEEKKYQEFASDNKRFFDIFVRSRFISGFIIPLSILINNMAFVILCIVGGIMMIKGHLTIGEFQAFVFFGNMVNTPISTMAASMNNIQDGLTAASRVYEFLDEEEEEKESPTLKINSSEIKGSVEFKNVRFGYIPDKPLMHDVSFKTAPGQIVAVVGPSGAGKTTLVNLLMRFYEISGGEIYLDGMDTKKIDKHNLREAFGMVLQDTWIFDGTIADNIRYGNPKASMKDIVEAAKKVQCDSFIEKLPKKYDTYISEENSGLSQGEMQLLAIARTVLANPKILILDEATSQVDTKTEYLITRAMENLMKDRTTFIIAHRLFTIKNADKIIYMEEGDIKEVGNHHELMQMNGKYASLYRQAASS